MFFRQLYAELRIQQAPDVTYHDGTYYLYYAVSTFGTQVSAIGLATSTTMNPGTWTDHGSTGIASTSGKPYNAIDPNLIIVGSTPYLNFGSFWHDIYQVKLTSALSAPTASSYNIEYDAAGTHPCEGSYMFEYDGYYYLLWSHGICCNYNVYVLPLCLPSMFVLIGKQCSACPWS